MSASRRLTWAAAAAATLGLLVRFVYALAFHHPRNHVSSDAYEYVALAERLAATPNAQSLSDTIWPPGTSALFALLLKWDGSLTGLALASALGSVCVAALVTSTAWAMAGRSAACWALIFASLHLGYVHYAGFTLAEQFFQLTATFAICSTVYALRALELPDTPRRNLWVWGGAVGVAWGLAALFRPNALPVLAASWLALAVFVLRHRLQRAGLHMGLGLLLGLVVVIGPAADRCTRNAASPCLVSNNIAMNMAMGQIENLYGLEFRDPTTNRNATTWVPPALLHHGYTGLGRVPATIYDTRGVLAWWWDTVSAAPGAAIVRAIGNALDLFGLNYWPDNYGRLGRRFAHVLKQLFFALVLVPGLVGLVRLGRRCRDREDASAVSWFFVSAFAGMMGGAALSLGEARYRLPFDALLLVPAAMVYANHAAPTKASASSSSVRLGSLMLAAGLIVASALLCVAHPLVGLAQHIPTRMSLLGVAGERDVLDPKRMKKPRKGKQAWNAQGNHVFRCDPACREAVLRPTAPSEAGWTHVSLSVDHNDRYRVFFYRRNEAVAFTDIPARTGANGLRTTRLEIPAAAREGLTAVGVVPLYGDGRYSVGHVQLQSR